MNLKNYLAKKNRLILFCFVLLTYDLLASNSIKDMNNKIKNIDKQIAQKNTRIKVINVETTKLQEEIKKLNIEISKNEKEKEEIMREIEIVKKY